MDRKDVLIVGGGHGGAQTAIMLRQLGFEGSVAIIGEEPELPYDRPPLSKEYLAGEKPFERLLLRPETFWKERNVEMLLGRRVVRVNPRDRTVSTASGESWGYNSLVWATGGAPRMLSCVGHDLAGIHTIRCRADVLALMAELDGARRAVVVGGGYIGLEAAAVLTKLGKQVVLLEALDRILARVAGQTLSAFYEQEHRAHGVDLRTGQRIACIEGTDGRVTGVRLGDGEVLPADLVIVGIGIDPSVQPLIEAGAAGGNGVLVDEFCRTTLPGVFAIGDCAAHANPFAEGAVIRVESVQNANDQATTAARAIVGRPEPYHATPWFWSNQFDLRLQTVGLSQGHDQAVVRGDPEARSFSVVYLKKGKVVALDCVNVTRDYAQGRKLVEAGAQIDPARLADASTPLKEMLPSA